MSIASTIMVLRDIVITIIITTNILFLFVKLVT